MKKHLQRLAILVFLIPICVWAKTELVEKTTTGFGESYQTALSSALMDAVRQVRGLEVGSEKQLKLDFKHLVNDSLEKKTASFGVEEQVFTQSKGWVQSYSVSSVKKPKDNNDVWEVSVVAKIPMHHSEIKDDARSSIAVMPFRFTHATFAIDDLEKGSNAFQMSSRMRDKIQTSLMQTQQFTVVNRNYGSEYVSEKALLSSNNVPAVEASRLGNLVGADFMIVGNIHDLSTKIERQTFYGMTQVEVIDRFDLSYQVIEVATQKILWTDNLVEEQARAETESTSSVLDDIAGLVVSSIMDVIYPVKVMDVVSPSEVYLNQGKSRVSEGDKFELLSQGRTLKDPDTGISIKIEGKKVGELTVDSVLPKYSVATLTSGDVKAVKKGAVVRLVKKSSSVTDIETNKQVRPTAGSSAAPIQW
ncbi:penicillin-binding protein activator LpoB [Alkalimarinus alittae]|uniref:Penicillin-binding protein activator LpoB n=1 Tax=Alkalimarinus alittae TaxID=2961619 RepID=A0ABY6N0S1_9ALTE|nr:penicillin-binding protein activator LpoB [Alkalimarinus alittae]UZE95664.1 penicillin-binding protein activator LpoB [Alkalimarinus alittae]